MDQFQVTAAKKLLQIEDISMNFLPDRDSYVRAFIKKHLESILYSENKCCKLSVEKKRTGFQQESQQ